MTIYILMLLIAPLFIYFGTLTSKRPILSKLFYIIGILIPALIAGLRDTSVGTDLNVYVYYHYYLAHVSSSILDFLSLIHGDVLYLILVFITTKLFNNFNILLFVIQLINSLCFFYFLKNVSKNTKISLPLAYFIYLVCFYFRSLNLVRQHLAISFSLVAFTHLLHNKNKSFFFWTIIATLFHSSAIFTLLIYIYYKLLKDNKTEKKKVVILLVASLILILFTYKYFLPFLRDIPLFANLSTVQNSSFVKQNLSIDIIDTFYKIFWILFIIFLNSKNKTSKINNYNFYFTMLIVDLIFYEFNIFVDYAERISLYYGIIPYLILIPQLSKLCKQDKLNKLVINIIIIIIFLSYFLLKFVYQNAGAIMPYKSIILGL